jgi:hypothetical protein
MSLTSLSAYRQWLAETTVNAARDSAWTVMLLEAEDAVKRYLRQNVESQSVTSILAGPPQTTLVLPQIPVQVSGFTLYRNDNANGDTTAFTAADLLTLYTDYTLDIADDDPAVSRSGLVRSLTSTWGNARERGVYSLTPRLVPTPGNIKVVYTAGYATIPASIVTAVHIITSRLWNMRKRGYPLIGESLNGYSYSAQGTATAEGIIQGDPTIRKMLYPFGRQVFVASYY